MTKFGPGGNSASFYDAGYKSTVEAPKWLHSIGLDAYEYECGNGVRVGKDTAIRIGEEAKKYDVELSIHAPYFISLASEEPEKRERSIGYIIETLQIAKLMDAKRIVVHPGGVGKMKREEAFSLACKTIKETVIIARELGLGDIYICPETMGKINQLGTLEEIVEMCKLDDMLLPTIDFGHINARTLGGLKTEQDFIDILEYMIKELGDKKGRNFHAHFSKIEYTKGGEKRHLTFEDEVYGPDFKLLAGTIKKVGVNPTIICESAGTMAEDALTMKKILEAL